MTKLFLDDVRNPPDDTWIVVRSFDEFVAFFSNNPTPELISFDHDLGEITSVGISSGMDCAKWLVENQISGFDFIVHSENPPGKKNIEGLLRNWIKFCEDSKEA